MEFIGPIISLGVGVLWAWGCYNLAEKKGRNPGLAAVMGFLFGLFAYLVYALLSDNSYKTYEPGGYSTTPKNVPPPTRTCWSCNSPVAGATAVCQSCGVKLQF